MASLQKNRTRQSIIIARISDEPRVISYEWEEFVGKLSKSDDPYLRKVGLQEKATLDSMQPGK